MEKSQFHLVVQKVDVLRSPYVAVTGIVEISSITVNDRVRVHNAEVIAACLGLELWFLDYFDGKPVWVLNREHLAYLEADLRENPHAAYPVMRTQANHLPTFMKTAKNKTRIVRLLRQMQHK